MFLLCSRQRALFSPGEPPCTGAGGWSRGGACGAAHRRAAAREAGSAQGRVHPQGCACSLEARPLCTTAELWQVQREAKHILSGLCAAGVRGRSGQKPLRGTPESWHSYLHMSWRPGVPLPRFLNHSAQPTSLHTDAGRSRAPERPGRAVARHRPSLVREKSYFGRAKMLTVRSSSSAEVRSVTYSSTNESCTSMFLASR